MKISVHSNTGFKAKIKNINMIKHRCPLKLKYIFSYILDSLSSTCYNFIPT